MEVQGNFLYFAYLALFFVYYKCIFCYIYAIFNMHFSKDKENIID